MTDICLTYAQLVGLCLGAAVLTAARPQAVARLGLRAARKRLGLGDPKPDDCAADAGAPDGSGDADDTQEPR